MSYKRIILSVIYLLTILSCARNNEDILLKPLSEDGVYKKEKELLSNFYKIFCEYESWYYNKDQLTKSTLDEDERQGEIIKNRIYNLFADKSIVDLMINNLLTRVSQQYDPLLYMISRAEIVSMEKMNGTNQKKWVVKVRTNHVLYSWYILNREIERVFKYYNEKSKATIDISSSQKECERLRQNNYLGKGPVIFIESTESHIFTLINDVKGFKIKDFVFEIIDYKAIVE